jgi:hypothetical protein
MHTYLLLLHETPADAAPMTAAEMKDLIGQYQAWSQSLAEQGLLAGGEKLTDDGGRQLRLQRGQVLASDGPYAEAHDVVGGYFLIKAADDAAAEALARTCPHLRGTQWIEVRKIEVL